LGFEAVQAIDRGKSDVMVGIINNNVTFTPLKDTFGKIKAINSDLVALAKILR
jgi:6-phosphofructokinase 1